MAKVLDKAAESGTIPPMFTPLTLRGMTLANRVVMSPMCMYSAGNGAVDDFHLVHYGSRAVGGAGLVMTEMTGISPDGRISLGCAGIWDDRHIAPWKRVTDFVHARTDARIAIQIGHAGRKGAQRLPWEGRAAPLDADKGWPLIAPSAIPFSDKDPVPKAMDEADIAQVIDDFAAAARRADAAGFDMVELHFGHGYLISSFISPLSNRRNDGWGGSLENRLRLPLAIFRAVRAALPEEKPVSARISAVDWAEGGTTAEDSVEIGRAFRAAGLDILDVSTGNVVAGGRPASEGLFQTPFSERIRREAGIPTMTVGNIRTAEEINDVLAAGRADLCVMAKGQLFDPYFVRHAAYAQGYALPWPKPYARVAQFRPG
jgi:anthraniloyl-CoA monooxygenase